MGIAAGDPEPVDDKKGIDEMLREFKLKQFDQQDEAVCFLRYVVEFFQRNEL
jgi:hypothetical protein